jgi:hypothetical protein
MEKQKEYNLRYLLAKVRTTLKKSVGQSPTAGEQTQQKPFRTSFVIGKSYCRTRSDVGSERVKILHFLAVWFVFHTLFLSANITASVFC